MCAIQICYRPPPPKGIYCSMIVNLRSLNVSDRNVVPLTEFDRVVEPIGPQSRKSLFESRKFLCVSSQDIDTHEGSTHGVVFEPPRPGWQRTSLVGHPSDEFEQGGPDRRRSSLRRRDVTVNKDQTV